MTTASIAGRGAMLKASEVAQLFDVTPQTVYRWVKEGQIPFTRIGGRSIRFAREDVTALLGERPTDEPDDVLHLPTKEEQAEPRAGLEMMVMDLLLGLIADAVVARLKKSDGPVTVKTAS